jgi:hypothetical protein
MLRRRNSIVSLSILLGMCLILLAFFSGHVDARGLKGASTTDIMEGEEMPMDQQDRELFELPTEIQNAIDTAIAIAGALQQAYSVVQELLGVLGIQI